MKDKKRKINVVDIIVILIIVAAVVFFASRYLGIGDSETNGTVNINYQVTIEAMPVELYENALMKVPAQMIASGSVVNGHVLSVNATPCVVESFESKDPYNSNVTYKVIPDPDRKFVTVVFDCVATVSNGSILNELGTQELRLGRSHIVKTHELELVGVITSLTIQGNTP